MVFRPSVQSRMTGSGFPVPEERKGEAMPTQCRRNPFQLSACEKVNGEGLERTIREVSTTEQTQKYRVGTDETILHGKTHIGYHVFNFSDGSAFSHHPDGGDRHTD